MSSNRKLVAPQVPPKPKGGRVTAADAEYTDESGNGEHLYSNVQDASRQISWTSNDDFPLPPPPPELSLLNEPLMSDIQDTLPPPPPPHMPPPPHPSSSTAHVRGTDRVSPQPSRDHQNVMFQAAALGRQLQPRQQEWVGNTAGGRQTAEPQTPSHHGLGRQIAQPQLKAYNPSGSSQQSHIPSLATHQPEWRQQQLETKDLPYISSKASSRTQPSFSPPSPYTSSSSSYDKPSYTSDTSQYRPENSTGNKHAGKLEISQGSESSTSPNITRAVPQGDSKEDEVDQLTNLLVQSINSSSDPEFIGICAKCNKKVMGAQNGCSAMKQIFHVQCFICSTCGCRLEGSPFYALEGKPYCEDCYTDSLEKCTTCSQPIKGPFLRATGKPYHSACFTCIVCGKCLDGVQFTIDATNQIYCVEDFHRKFAPKCSVCSAPIIPEDGEEDAISVVAMDRRFHVKCYKCEDCGLVLSSEKEGRGCYPIDDHILCKSCSAQRVRKMTTSMTTEL